MKSFYGTPSSGVCAPPLSATATTSNLRARAHARVAVYDAAAAAPRVERIEPGPAREYIEEVASRVFELARERGGSIPYTVIRELTENLIHADFAEPVVSVLDDGNTIRFSDQGPGIGDKKRALLPGYTTANRSMKEVIRGVGSGLPIVNDFLSLTGGSLSIEDNLASGSVITVCSSSTGRVVAAVNEPAPDLPAPPKQETSLFGASDGDASARPRLTRRQQQVLALVLESGTAGPSIVSRELNVGLSTAYRDLASLEEMGLIEAESGKRTLTPSGLSYLSDMSSSLSDLSV